jgi:hypothetical protein
VSVRVKVLASRVVQGRPCRVGDDFIEDGSEVVGIRQAALVGFVDGGLEVVAGEGGRDVDERGDRGGDRDALVLGYVLGIEGGPAVDGKSGPARGSGGRET